VRRAPATIVGPLGLWPWPVLNFLLSFIYYARLRTGVGSSTVENVEEWELVTDERGELKKIIVHRRVVRR